MKEGGGSFFKDRLEASGGGEIGKGLFGVGAAGEVQPAGRNAVDARPTSLNF